MADNKQITNNDIQDSNRSQDNTTASTNNRKYNIENLSMFGKDKPVLSHEEAKKNGSKGGIKSGEVRKAKKTMRETLQDALQIELPSDKLQDLGADITLLNGNNTVLSAVVASTIREAINGDTKAIQFIRDSIGEQPKQEVVAELITKDDLQIINDLKDMLKG